MGEIVYIIRPYWDRYEHHLKIFVRVYNYNTNKNNYFQIEQPTLGL